LQLDKRREVKSVARNPQVKIVVLWGTMALRLFAEPYYRGMAKACESDFSLPLPYGGLGAIEKTYHRLKRHLEAIQGDDVLIIVAHSQGGLVASLYVAEHPNSYLVALGTPFGGAELARLTRLAPKCMWRRLRALPDMAPNSQFIQMLNSDVLPLSGNRIRSIYTVPDHLVSARSAHLSAGANHCIVAMEKHYRKHAGRDDLTVHFMPKHRMGHIQEVLDKSIHDVIRIEIDDIIMSHPFAPLLQQPVADTVPAQRLPVLNIPALS
jgi:pimeloyl-ACP methyl ester carboxylesterase